MLKHYKVVSLPKDGIRHNLGDRFGLVLFKETEIDHLTDDIAKVAIDAGLPYFKKESDAISKSEVVKV